MPGEAGDRNSQEDFPVMEGGRGEKGRREGEKGGRGVEGEEGKERD